ncbi:N-acetylglucosaminyldiphosphoundecaprenol N-acetyl-beta-D-mannosaminyltransferase [bacterium HR33]|nr:N-acetylglucosaminyldiphosphoundecaprenol N-acetyl-beta-D-mannosaminyltransferase [bacterium HR33]
MLSADAPLRFVNRWGIPCVMVGPLPIADTSEDAFVRIAAVRLKASAGGVVVTPNLNHLAGLSHDPRLLRQYLGADVMLPDGIPIVLLSRALTGLPIRRVTGSGVVARLLPVTANLGARIALVGGSRQTHSRFRRKLAELGLEEDRILGVELSFPFNPASPEAHRAAATVAAFRPQLVLVALGFPTQERWATAFSRLFPAAVVLCVGAAVDFFAGVKRRAPRFLQTTGLEWLWRVCTEPRRLLPRYVRDAFALPAIVKLLRDESRVP